MQYEIILRRSVAERAFTLDRSRRRCFEAWLDRISHDPFEAGDFDDTDATGRGHQVKRVDELLVTYWADHASREVRIVGLDVLPEEEAEVEK